MGRPREFEEHRVLAAAGEVFWTQGYEGTSTRDLVAATGLAHSSLYGAFGDKRELFIKALSQYLDQTLRERIQRIEASFTGLKAIKQFFAEGIENAIADALHRGCMMVNTAIDASAKDAEFLQIVADETRNIEAFFYRCVKAGQVSGQITKALPAADIARHLLSVLMGLRVLARVRPEPSLLKGLLRSTLMLLSAPT